MHSYVSNIGFNQNSSKKAGFNEKPHFPEHLKTPEVRPISIGSYPISACAIDTILPAHFGKIKQSHTELVFLFLLLLFFCLSLILSSLVLSLLCILQNTKKDFLNVREFASLSCYCFPHSG